MEVMNIALHHHFKQKSLHFFLSVSAFFLLSASFAQIKFSLKCNDRKVGKNDYVQIQFEVENGLNVETITPPVFKNFAVVSGPNQQSSMSNINGNIRQTLALGYVLKPLTTGTLIIGSAKARVDGREYFTNPVAIEVSNSSSPGRQGAAGTVSPFSNFGFDLSYEQPTHQFDDYILRKGEKVEEKIKKSLFTRIDVNKTSCYVGEPLIATYKLYTRLKSESNVLKTPSFNGFSVSEMGMPENYPLTHEKFNGRDYNVYTLRKVQLYPLQSGSLTLEPLEVENKVTFLKDDYAGKRRGDVLYDILREFADEAAPGNATQVEQVTIRSTPVNIEVKPLPDENKPAQFKGAVGDFKINAQLEKNSFTTDDAGNLLINIAGAGNIQMINAPAVKWPNGVEGFEPKSEENIDKISTPMQGQKIFRYPFTVDKPGNYLLPSIAFSYFDVHAKNYKTISTQPISFHVEKGTGNRKTIFTPGDDKKNAEKDFVTAVNDYKWYLAGGAVAFLLVLIAVKTKKQKDTKKNTSETLPHAIETLSEKPAFILPVNPLQEAEEKLIENGADFYQVLDIGFKKYLAEKLKLSCSELSKKKINEKLDKNNVSVGTSVLLNTLLEDIEVNLYAPFSSEVQKQEVYEKASEVVSLLDKQIN